MSIQIQFEIHVPMILTHVGPFWRNAKGLRGAWFRPVRQGLDTLCAIIFMCAAVNTDLYETLCTGAFVMV